MNKETVIATVQAFKGSITIINQEGEVRVAKAGDPIFLGDTLHTAEDASAVLIYANGMQEQVFGDTVFTFHDDDIINYDPNQILINNTVPETLEHLVMEVGANALTLSATDILSISNKTLADLKDTNENELGFIDASHDEKDVLFINGNSEATINLEGKGNEWISLGTGSVFGIGEYSAYAGPEAIVLVDLAVTTVNVNV